MASLPAHYCCFAVTVFLSWLGFGAGNNVLPLIESDWEEEEVTPKVSSVKEEIEDSMVFGVVSSGFIAAGMGVRE